MPMFVSVKSYGRLSHFWAENPSTALSWYQSGWALSCYNFCAQQSAQVLLEKTLHAVLALPNGNAISLRLLKVVQKQDSYFQHTTYKKHRWSLYYPPTCTFWRVLMCLQHNVANFNFCPQCSFQKAQVVHWILCDAFKWAMYGTYILALFKR